MSRANLRSFESLKIDPPPILRKRKGTIFMRNFTLFVCEKLFSEKFMEKKKNKRTKQW